MNKTASNDQSFLESLNKAIEDNLLNEQFGVEEFAREIGVSRSQLHRKLHELTGQSASQLMREYRLKKARELLEKEQATVAEVAYQVGFGSPSYFNTCFHDYFGYTPGEVKIRKSFVSKRKPFITKKIAIIFASILVVPATIYYSLSLTRSDVDNIPKPLMIEKSIAVLPITNQSESEEYAYFGDALTDEIIIQLMKVKDFEVRSNTSVMKYKNSDKSILEIGKELNINYVIVGAAQRFEGKLRLRVQLIDAKTDEYIWGDVYERKWEDVFALQSEVAKEISSELQAVLSPEEVENIETKPTNNLEAYQHYLKATELQMNITPDFKSRNQNLSSAIFHLYKAIELDSNFALSYLGLGVAYFNRAYWSEYWKTSFGDSLIYYVNKAVELDTDLPEAYLYKGKYFLDVKTDETNAIKNARYALKLRPNYGDAFWLLAKSYEQKKDFVEAIMNYKFALKMKIGDNDYSSLLKDLGNAYMQIQEHSKAELTLLKVAEIYQDYGVLSWFYLVMGDSIKLDDIAEKTCALDSGYNCWIQLDDYYTMRGDYENALKYKTLRRIELESNNRLELSELHRDGYLLWKLGRKEEAMTFFNKQINYCEKSIKLNRPYAKSGARYDLAGVYTFLGEKEKAYDILHKMEDQWFDGELLDYIKVDPLFENLWKDQEFKDIIKRQEKKFAVIRAEIDQLEKESKL